MRNKGEGLNEVDRMRADGWPLRIIGNGGHEAVLVGKQLLTGGEYCGVYRYPGGDCCMFLDEIRLCHTIIEK